MPNPRSEQATLRAELRRRKALIAEIAVMSEESFGYIVSACLQLEQYVDNNGFLPESLESFKKVVAEATSYAKGV